MKVRATLIELWKKVTPFKEQEKVFWNGENNDYSEEIERVVSNSPTGARAQVMFSKFIFGSGITEDLNLKLDNGTLLSEVAKDVVDDISMQYGAFIHTTYGIETDEDGNVLILPKTPKSLDYHKCRISEDDDDGNKGMILYKHFNKQDRTVTKKEKDYKRKYYPFNPSQSVVMQQIDADAKLAKYTGDELGEKIKHYRGQVMYVNLTPKYRYSISKFDPVFNDLDTEYRISVYFNTSTRGGFLGKMAVLTQGLDEESAKEIKTDIANWLGAEGSSDVYHLDVEQIENLDNVLKVVQIKSQFDDKQFSVVMPNIRKNILGAANNLPEGLAFADATTLFAGSGESYKQMKQFYWEQCEWERQKIEEAFWKLGFEFNFLDFDGTEAKPTDEVEASPEASDETLQAQAALRGSVGGVQGILGIQSSVSQGLTDFESAITILMEIYGFSRDISASLLGKPDIADGNRIE
jgi:hypothetical protein